MTDKQLERRYTILEKLMEDKRNYYAINLNYTFISIRNKTTMQGIYTDSLQSAKRWIVKDMRKRKVKGEKYEEDQRDSSSIE